MREREGEWRGSEQELRGGGGGGWNRKQRLKKPGENDSINRCGGGGLSSLSSGDR